MLNKTKIFLLLFIMNAPLAMECKTVDIEYRFNKNKIEEKLPVCFKDTSFISNNCKDNNCHAINVLKEPIDKTDLFSFVGSPLFEVCRRLGGEPKLFDIKLNKDFESSAYCLFKKDSSFVSLDYFNEYLEEGKKDISLAGQQ
ncbi:hypothetical protein [Bacteriovorax sp. BSW11_IV]|uniref:hypothetical protein n=1 Tax=Bacteriovorax sp. BSW11_IV TaxID=1353529 RepID=UPI00055919DA|nr:hypothetical protein [Bacteriovorax sp. BSW11_IV]